MEQLLDGKRIVLGTCYYPEHWEREDWEPDLKRMREYGIEVVRVAEFAWSKVEPEEGVYTFDFWDDFLDAAQRCGVRVIFCTPTATPPAWLTDTYPEVLNADIDGVLYRHGNRQHANYNSPKYREFCARIVERLAEHYGKHPAIIGWQLDNELNCSLRDFYSESDTYAFRAFLKEKYQTLEALNRAWGNVFWNQTYTAWREIYVPRRVPSGAVNPHLLMDYIRFVSESTCRFAKMQADIIKKYRKPGDFITTNGLFGNLDSHRLTGESLDFFMYDSYPNFAYAYDGSGLNGLRDRKWSRNLSEVRSISPAFGIMEQQSGPGGWSNRMEACAPRPGQMTLWSMQSIAHGADYVSYFRWRTSTIGTEIYWHGLLDYSGRENRRMRELLAFHEKLQRMDEVAGSRYLARVGVLQDYDNQWDSQLDTWHQRVESCSKEGIYTAAQRLHTPLDYVHLKDDTSVSELRRYSVLFYPHAVILTQKRMETLKQYVAQGGCLVMGCRTGYKDQNGRCVREMLPGLARELTGADVMEYSFVAPDEAPVFVSWGEDRIEAAIFQDMLAPLTEQAEVAGCFENGMYAGEAALIHSRYAGGEVYYFGGAFSADTAEIFLRKLQVSEPYRELIELPEECELAVRKKQDTEYLFLLNYSSQPLSLKLKQPLYNLYADTVWEGVCELEKYGVAVLVLKKQNGEGTNELCD